MIIEHGMQPNCSELVIRLPGWNRKDVLEVLKNHDIIEMMVFDSTYTDDSWDQMDFAKPLSEINPKAVEIWKKSKRATTTEKYEKYNKEFADIMGFNPNYTHINLIEKGSKPDIENGSALWLGSDEDEPAIWYHQHCQPQGFPLLKKISDLFKAEVDPDDGGSINEYEEWLEQNGYYDQPETENYN